MKMHVTVVPKDSLIIVDGEALFFSYEVPEGVHAIQWHTLEGIIEYNAMSPRSLAESDYAIEVAPFVALWEAEKLRIESLPEEPYNPPLDILPQEAMTKREFLKLIIALTKDTPEPISLTDIETYVASAPDEIRLEWDYATFIERSHPLLDNVAADFGVTSEMLDMVFINKEDLLYKVDNNIPLHEN